MAFKVLENNGTLTTASDGITINKLNQHDKNGIIKGRLNDLAITNSSNTLYVSSGHLVISGINLILENAEEFTIAPVSSSTQRYLIVEIVATSEGITAELKVVNQYSSGGLDFTADVITGTYRHLIATLLVGISGIVSVSKELNFLEDNHLYEHNIVMADNLNIRNATDIVTFKLLTNSATPFSSASDIADLLYTRGLMTRDTCMVASGRCSNDSFSFVDDINFDTEYYNTKYCESIIIGVYGDVDSDLYYVYVSMDEDESSPVAYNIVPDTYLHDEVVPIL